jgi:hypothetical protein
MSPVSVTILPPEITVLRDITVVDPPIGDAGSGAWPGQECWRSIGPRRAR